MSDLLSARSSSFVMYTCYIHMYAILYVCILFLMYACAMCLAASDQVVPEDHGPILTGLGVGIKRGSGSLVVNSSPSKIFCMVVSRDD